MGAVRRQGSQDAKTKRILATRSALADRSHTSRPAAYPTQRESEIERMGLAYPRNRSLFQEEGC